ncbi:MAG: hypothetical protein E7418_06005 [Ruminococcaceae bacterium]|nr:hypothetical protein [Oscillospiraceae bacterium]
MNTSKIEIIVQFDVVLIHADCPLINLHDITQLFKVLANTGVSIDLISFIPSRRTGSTLSFSTFSSDFSKVLRAIAQLKNQCGNMRIEVNGGYSKITLKGSRFLQETGIAAGFFNTILEIDSELMLVTATGNAIDVLVRTDELDKTVAALEQAFPETETVYPE